MENLTQAQRERVFDFLNGLDTEVRITDFVNFEEIDFENAYESIHDVLNDKGGFDVEIIYYSNAIEYLKENDPSLNESLEIAMECGYEMQNLSSEVLASLLASQNARESFCGLESEIEAFFEELREEIEEQTELIINTFNERYLMDAIDLEDIESFFNDEASEAISEEEKEAFKKEFNLNF